MAVLDCGATNRKKKHGGNSTVVRRPQCIRLSVCMQSMHVSLCGSVSYEPGGAATDRCSTGDLFEL